MVSWLRSCFPTVPDVSGCSVLDILSWAKCWRNWYNSLQDHKTWRKLVCCFCQVLDHADTRRLTPRYCAHAITRIFMATGFVRMCVKPFRRSEENIGEYSNFEVWQIAVKNHSNYIQLWAPRTMLPLKCWIRNWDGKATGLQISTAIGIGSFLFVSAIQSIHVGFARICCGNSPVYRILDDWSSWSRLLWYIRVRLPGSGEVLAKSRYCSFRWI